MKILMGIDMYVNKIRKINCLLKRTGQNVNNS